MKITIVLGAFLPVPPIMGGAVEKAWFMLAGEFARRGHEVVLISRAMPEFADEEISDGVRHIRVQGFNTPSSLWWLKFLDLIYSKRAISVLPPADLLVTNTFWLPILLRSAKRGRVYVHVARYPKGQMRFYRSAARLQAPSHAVARAISREDPQLESKVAVIPYPAPVSTAPDEPPSTLARDRVILFVGRVHPEKGVHLLVQAFAGGARTVFAGWKLIIVGPTEKKLGGGGKAYLASLRQLANAVSPKVAFAGAVFDRPTLEAYFRAARLFVYPSLADTGESFGLAPLEAMTHRCAVVVSQLECFRDFVREGETGLIFDHHSPNPAETLQHKMRDVIGDETALARIADTGYRQSREYALPLVADQFLSDFNSLT